MSILPSRARLVKAYERLQWKHAKPIEAKTLVKWAAWARIDPRLAEILVLFFVRFFRSLHPTLLWEANKQSDQPQTLAALVDFARAEAKRTLPAAESLAFEAWAKALLWRVPKGPPQMFFLREGTPRPGRDRAELERNLRAFERWGFIGENEPLSGKMRGSATLLGPKERKNILARLIQEKDSFTVGDYIRACEGRVHPRMAERDLRSHSGLDKAGFTRSTIYRRKARSKKQAV